MTQDEKIIQRFEELIAKAKDLEKTITIINKENGKSVLDETLFFEWTTSVMSLFESLYDKDSSKIKTFNDLCEDPHTRSQTGKALCFERCRGVFLSAYEDYKKGY